MYDRYGVETVCMHRFRRSRALDHRMLGTWLSYDDLTELIRLHPIFAQRRAYGRHRGIGQQTLVVGQPPKQTQRMDAEDRPSPSVVGQCPAARRPRCRCIQAKPVRQIRLPPTLASTVNELIFDGHGVGKASAWRIGGLPAVLGGRPGEGNLSRNGPQWRRTFP